MAELGISTPGQKTFPFCIRRVCFLKLWYMRVAQTKGFAHDFLPQVGLPVYNVVPSWVTEGYTPSLLSCAVLNSLDTVDGVLFSSKSTSVSKNPFSGDLKRTV
jgi:hypothetical protein